MSHEAPGKSDDWHTPKYVFDALSCVFDLDAAAPIDRTFVYTPARAFISEDSLSKDWQGFVWLNPPFGNHSNKMLWLKKFFDHGNGVALTPDRTCTKWFHYAAGRADAILFPEGRINFLLPNGLLPRSKKTGSVQGAGTNSCLWASGPLGVKALKTAEVNGLGKVFIRD